MVLTISPFPADFIEIVTSHILSDCELDADSNTVIANRSKALSIRCPLFHQVPQQ